MGLDQYIYVREKKNRDAQKEQNGIIENQDNPDALPQDQDFEIAYFRKFNALQGYFERKFYAVAPDGLDINCQNVEITQEDIDKLYTACKQYLNSSSDNEGYYEGIDSSELRPTEGFFYGSSLVYYRNIENLVDVLRNIQEHLDLGDLVYYTCWY